MTQWDSKVLGEQGRNPIEILRHFYGDDMYINIAEGVSGVPATWPGSNLMVGSSGDKVLKLQEQLNTVANAYPALPFLTADGKYGTETADAVRGFQEVFGLSPTGVVNHATWYNISHIYVAISRCTQL